MTRRKDHVHGAAVAGHWYPAGLQSKDFNGVFSYQVRLRPS